VGIEAALPAIPDSVRGLVSCQPAVSGWTRLGRREFPSPADSSKDRNE
jgi:hypothetical protein